MMLKSYFNYMPPLPQQTNKQTHKQTSCWLVHSRCLDVWWMPFVQSSCNNCIMMNTDCPLVVLSVSYMGENINRKAFYKSNFTLLNSNVFILRLMFLNVFPYENKMQNSSAVWLHTGPKGGSIHTEMILNMQERHMLYVLAMFTKEY